MSKFTNSVNSIETVVSTTLNLSTVSATQMMLKLNSILSIKEYQCQKMVVLKDLLTLKKILLVNNQLMEKTKCLNPRNVKILRKSYSATTT